MPMAWTDSITVAALARISDRKARLALRRAIAGVPWRGASLVVREVRGRGGRSGFHYEVLASSLPLGLQEELKAYRAPFEEPSKPRGDRTVVRDWWLTVLADVLRTERHSSERADAIADLADRSERGQVPDWNGRPKQLTPRTIHRKLALYDNGGVVALSGHHRSDKGTRRVVLSDRWDSTVPFDQATREHVAEKLRAYGSA